MAVQSGQSFDSIAVLDLLDRLGIEDDELAVLSVVYDRDQKQLVLRHAKLLFGPSAIGDSSWANWHNHDQVDPIWGAPSAYDLNPEWFFDGGDFVAGRAVLSRDFAREWLRRLADASSLIPEAGPLPRASAKLASPKAFLRVFPDLETPMSGYAIMSRPLQGFFFEGEGRADRKFPDDWEIDGARVYGAPLTALGIGMRMESNVVAHAPPVGLFVGRMERRAWIAGAHGSGDYETFKVHIRWDPTRCDLADLEVELEEWEGAELAYSRRLSLGDIELPGRDTGDRGTLDLPTLGRRIRHGARLHHRDGALLDITAPHWLVEQINFTFSVRAEGADTGTTTSFQGENYEPTATERIERFDRAEREYREWLEKGLAGRIIRDATTAMALIKSELKLARGELLVLDPYFGADPLDWQVLNDTAVPVRVLTGAKAHPPASPMPNVDARKFRFRRAPEFHDRFYLWNEGGLSVGTSPSGLGKRDARIDRLDPVEAGGWKALFETYWGSSDYVAL